MVIRSGPDLAELRCGSTAMRPKAAREAPGAAPATADPCRGDGLRLGKRYVVADEGFEALCVRAGQGDLTVDGLALVVKDAKQLPASD